MDLPRDALVIIPSVAFIIRDAVPVDALEAVVVGLPQVKVTRTKPFYARFGVPYSYRGTPLITRPFSSALQVVVNSVSARIGPPFTFNAAVLCCYPDGSHGLAPHSDTKAIPELGKRPAIASVSWGAARAFVLRPKGGGEELSTMLNAGDLLVMHGASQSDWLHSVPTVPGIVAPRWSLTLRNHSTSPL